MVGQLLENRAYFRGDQHDGVTGPNLLKTCTYAEHICHARGKLTQFSSISLNAAKISDFGETVYRANRTLLDDDRHHMIEHELLLDELRRAIRESSKQEKTQAISALRRAQRRREGLVDWKFDISRIDRKDVIAWANAAVQKYFTKVQ